MTPLGQSLITLLHVLIGILSLALIGAIVLLCILLVVLVTAGFIIYKEVYHVQ